MCESLLQRVVTCKHEMFPARAVCVSPLYQISCDRRCGGNLCREILSGECAVCVSHLSYTRVINRLDQAHAIEVDLTTTTNRVRLINPEKKKQRTSNANTQDMANPPYFGAHWTKVFVPWLKKIDELSEKVARDKESRRRRDEASRIRAVGMDSTRIGDNSIKIDTEDVPPTANNSNSNSDNDNTRQERQVSSDENSSGHGARDDDGDVMMANGNPPETASTTPATSLFQVHPSNETRSPAMYDPNGDAIMGEDAPVGHPTAAVVGQQHIASTRGLFTAPSAQQVASEQPDISSLTIPAPQNEDDMSYYELDTQSPVPDTSADDHFMNEFSQYSNMRPDDVPANSVEVTDARHGSLEDVSMLGSPYSDLANFAEQFTQYDTPLPGENTVAEAIDINDVVSASVPHPPINDSHSGGSQSANYSQGRYSLEIQSTPSPQIVQDQRAAHQIKSMPLQHIGTLPPPNPYKFFDQREANVLLEALWEAFNAETGLNEVKDRLPTLARLITQPLQSAIDIHRTDGKTYIKVLVINDVKDQNADKWMEEDSILQVNLKSICGGRLAAPTLREEIDKQLIRYLKHLAVMVRNAEDPWTSILPSLVLGSAAEVFVFCNATGGFLSVWDMELCWKVHNDRANFPDDAPGNEEYGDEVDIQKLARHRGWHIVEMFNEKQSKRKKDARVVVMGYGRHHKCPQALICMVILREHRRDGAQVTPQAPTWLCSPRKIIETKQCWNYISDNMERLTRGDPEPGRRAIVKVIPRPEMERKKRENEDLFRGKKRPAIPGRSPEHIVEGLNDVVYPRMATEVIKGLMERFNPQ